MRVIPAVALAGLLVVGACVGDGGGGAQTASSDGLTIGGLDTSDASLPADRISDQPFTDFDDKAGTFGQFAGKPLVVNFWASWCVPCVTEMPEFESVHQELIDEVTFVGVNVVDQLSDARTMAERTGVTYLLVRDPRGSLLRWAGGTQMPTTAFVDADGAVRKVVTRSLSADELRTEIRALL